jgi:hypothetical protein
LSLLVKNRGVKFCDTGGFSGISKRRYAAASKDKRDAIPMPNIECGLDFCASSGDIPYSIKDMP